MTLTLHADLPDRGLDYVSPQLGPTAADRTGDVRSVSWFIAERGAGGVAGGVADLAGANGLARSEGDRTALDAAELAGDVGTVASVGRVLAPEVTQIAFRYFDGAAWLEEWDSVTIGALPLAVEVTLAVDADGPPEQFRNRQHPEPRPGGVPVRGAHGAVHPHGGGDAVNRRSRALPLVAANGGDT